MSRWLRAFGEAIADIRQKVVEEPTYGRAVTPRSGSTSMGAPGEKSPEHSLGWFDRNFQSDPLRQGAATERDIHGNAREIER